MPLPELANIILKDKERGDFVRIERKKIEVLPKANQPEVADHQEHGQEVRKSAFEPGEKKDEEDSDEESMSEEESSKTSEEEVETSIQLKQNKTPARLAQNKPNPGKKSTSNDHSFSEI